MTATTIHVKCPHCNEGTPVDEMVINSIKINMTDTRYPCLKCSNVFILSPTIVIKIKLPLSENKA